MFVGLGAMVACAAWVGCAASNGDAPDETGGGNGASTGKPNAGSRPGFEAGFKDEPDAGNNPATQDGAACVDKDDPGSGEGVAKALPDTNDGQNNAITVNGVLSSAVDVDFYKLKVSDKFGHRRDPHFAIATPGVQMCVFVRCPGTTASVTCGGGGVASKSDLGTSGCCSTGPSSATPTWDCNGYNDSVLIYFRIKQTANKCAPYAFSYGF